MYTYLQLACSIARCCACVLPFLISCLPSYSYQLSSRFASWMAHFIGLSLWAGCSFVCLSIGVDQCFHFVFATCDLSCECLDLDFACRCASLLATELASADFCLVGFLSVCLFQCLYSRCFLFLSFFVRVRAMSELNKLPQASHRFLMSSKLWKFTF